MTKWIFTLVLAILVAGSWFKFDQSGDEILKMQEGINKVEYDGDREEKAPKMRSELSSIENERTFNGILLTFLSAGLVGILFVSFVLPILAEKVSSSVYDSGEEVEPDSFHNAHVLMAQGDWEGAIQAFQTGAAQDPTNRMPYVEIAKIQRIHQENPQAAITTLREAIQGQEWQENDAAFLMFRLAEIYDEDQADRLSASSTLEQIVALFPNTRHSANARTKLHEWGMA